MSAQATAPQIHIQRMTQLEEAIDPEDDWTGVKDAAVRRKRQNRLNVRAYRRRKMREVQDQSLAGPMVPCWVEDQKAVVLIPASAANLLNNPGHPLLSWEPTRTKLDGIMFPLSLDHRITLIQFNVLRSMLVNHEFVALLQSSVVAGDGAESSTLRVVSDPISAIPPPLHPTDLQRTVAHEDWIDSVPHANLRDNLIKAAGTYDEDELWSDIVGGLFEGCAASDIEERGVIVWSPPWDFRGYEVSEGFLRKWGWLLKGCHDILEATNQWRSQRGQDPLVFEV